MKFKLVLVEQMRGVLKGQRSEVCEMEHLIQVSTGNLKVFF